MAKVKKNQCGSIPRRKARVSQSFLGFLFAAVFALVLPGGLSAQSEFPAGDFWSLDAGTGMSGLVAKGTSFQFIIDPKLWLSPPLMVGSKLGMAYSVEDQTRVRSATSNILAFEGQVYLRWNFLRLGKNVNKKVNIFAQAGFGMTALYRGNDNPIDSGKGTRGSLLGGGALGVTIPLTERWHLEPQAGGGLPHIFGFSLTLGYKFPLPRKTEYIETPSRIEYGDVLKIFPPAEMAKHLRINAVEFILFGPDIATYNLGLDRDGQGLNELVLDETALFLKAHPEYLVRLEGHANPVTVDSREADELMMLSTLRANTVARQLIDRGVPEQQLAIMSFGGTRTVTSDQDKWNRNRRVELIIMRFDETAEAGD